MADKPISVKKAGDLMIVRMKGAMAAAILFRGIEPTDDQDHDMTPVMERWDD